MPGEVGPVVDDSPAEVPLLLTKFTPLPLLHTPSKEI